jgi:hypothetical protein
MDDEFLQGDVSSLSDGQEIILSVLMICSGVLSILGSSTIVYRVAENKTRTKPYDRIMLGLSVCDIVASFSYIVTPFLLPKETSQRVWASGSDGSCSILGWLTQLSFAAVVYNSLLSYYYLLTLKYSISHDDFESRFEPYWHSLTIFFFIFTATAGVPFQIFSEVELGQGCWVGEFPEGCEAKGECIDNSIGWVYGRIPILFTFVSLPVNNLLIYCHMKSMLKIGQEHTPAQELHTRRVATQSFLYAVTFFICYTPALVVRILESIGFDASQEADIYVLLILNSLLYPLQGFFNVFVYTRPNFLRLKRAGTSNLVALRGALFETDIPLFITQTMGGSGRGSPSIIDPVVEVQTGSFEQQEAFEIVSVEEPTEKDADADSFEDEKMPATGKYEATNEPKKLVSCMKSSLKSSSSSKRTQMDGSVVRSKY